MKTKYIRLINFLFIGLFATNSFGQANTKGMDNQAMMESAYNNIFLILGGIIVLAAIITLVRMVNVLMDIQKIRILDEHGIEAAEKSGLLQQNIFEKFNQWAWDIIPKGKEGTIDLGHEYDGIRELDNKLPPWWLALFYGSILFAAVYMWNYHWSGSDWSSQNEYIAQMKEGEEIKARFLDNAANSVDENSVFVMDGEVDLAAGKDIFMSKCAACHGVNGEGMTGLGPNFCDPYWVHGGGIKNVFKTIKYGVPEKGMISWKDQMNPVAMQQVSSYILTLEGTNPLNQKEPQGEIWVAEEEATTESIDSTETIETELEVEGQEVMEEIEE